MLIRNYIKKVVVNILKFWNFSKKQDSENEEEYVVNRSNLVDEIKEVCRKLDQTETWFQMENDEDLIEACIHQGEVLNARYRYLLNRIKLDKIS